MQRLLVAILAAVDAVIAVAVGVAATVAPLTLLWVFGFGGGAEWGALWPTGGTVWLFGNLVPLAIELPLEYLAVTGIDPAAASFALSLAPLAFAGFTIVFAARSGMRASRADAWITGVVSGTLVFAALTTLVALTSDTGLATYETWQAVLFPSLLFLVPALGAALATEWGEAGSGALARLRDRVEATPRDWGEVPGLAARGAAVVVAGLLGVGALVTAIAVFVRGGEIVALYEAAHLDVVGATIMTLGQLAYLPTLVVWAISFIAGPGFAVGAGTSVSPAGTQVGVVPGIPLLGAIPEATSPWMLLLALLPVALGAFAGWVCRSRLVHAAPRSAAPRPAWFRGGSSASPRPAARREAGAAREDDARTTVLAGLLAATDADRASAERAAAARAEAEREAERDTAGLGLVDEPHERDEPHGPGEPPPSHEPFAARFVLVIAIAAVSAAAAALLAVLASGSLGPGTLAALGPQAGHVALAVGLEVALGAGILLLSPRRRNRDDLPARDRSADRPTAAADGAAETAPID